MPATEMIVMVAVVSALALSFIQIVRLLGTLILHRTMRKLVERDPDHAESLISRLGQPPERTGDDRLSTILIAFGIAMIAASIVINDPGWMHYAVAGALFPLIIGGICGCACSCSSGPVAVAPDNDRGSCAVAPRCRRRQRGFRDAGQNIDGRCAGSSRGWTRRMRTMSRRKPSFAHGASPAATMDGPAIRPGSRGLPGGAIDQLRKRQPNLEQTAGVAQSHVMSVEIADMLDRLSQRERAALVLCEGHGWTHVEAAELLDLPLGTLKSLVARAKAKCREMWNGRPSCLMSSIASLVRRWRPRSAIPTAASSPASARASHSSSG